MSRADGSSPRNFATATRIWSRPLISGSIWRGAEAACELAVSGGELVEAALELARTRRQLVQPGGQRPAAAVELPDAGDQIALAGVQLPGARAELRDAARQR